MLVCLVCPKQNHINHHHHHHHNHHHEVSSASSPAQAVMDSDGGADLYGNCKISTQSPTVVYSKQECNIKSFTNQVIYSMDCTIPNPAFSRIYDLVIHSFLFSTNFLGYFKLLHLYIYIQRENLISLILLRIIAI